MDIKNWQVSELHDQLVEIWKRDVNSERTSQSWYDSIMALQRRAHARGDGVAIYVNNDLGHPDLGQWQVVSYGGPESQLETREGQYANPGLGESRSYIYGRDILPVILPDIGGAINWRYLLHAIVPPATSDVVSCSHPGCVYREGHDLAVFPHRVSALLDTDERPTFAGPDYSNNHG